MTKREAACYSCQWVHTHTHRRMLVRDELLTPAEVADWLQVPLSTLRIWRHRREGPPAVKVGRLLRYRAGAVEAWLEAQEREAAAGAR